jgi:predicted transcriptional regulator
MTRHYSRRCSVIKKFRQEICIFKVMKPSKKQTELAEKILQVEDENILNYIDAVLNNNAAQWEEELPDEIKKSIESGLEDMKAGRVTPHEEVRKKYEHWLKK